MKLFQVKAGSLDVHPSEKALVVNYELGTTNYFYKFIPSGGQL